MHHSSTGLPRVDAQEDFARARRAQIAARAARWLPGGRNGRSSPRSLDARATLPWGTARLRVIELAAVVGTLEPTIAFDASFRPASELVRARWERIALAHRRGIALPPISVLQRPTATTSSTAVTASRSSARSVTATSRHGSPASRMRYRPRPKRNGLTAV